MKVCCFLKKRLKTNKNAPVPYYLSQFRIPASAFCFRFAIPIPYPCLCSLILFPILLRPVASDWLRWLGGLAALAGLVGWEVLFFPQHVNVFIVSSMCGSVRGKYSIDFPNFPDTHRPHDAQPHPTTPSPPGRNEMIPLHSCAPFGVCCVGDTVLVDFLHICHVLPNGFL